MRYLSKEDVPFRRVNNDELLLQVFTPVLEYLSSLVLTECQTFSDICLREAQAFDEAYQVKVWGYTQAISGKLEQVVNELVDSMGV